MAQPVLLTTGTTIDPYSSGLPLDFYGAAADAAAANLPNVRRATVPLAGHVPDPGLLSPLLEDFYSDRTLA